MAKGRILYINQEIIPYSPETEVSYYGRYLPSYIQEQGREIRTFMPRFSYVNERRNQLHEVIRLSGMNLIIDDNDHQLIIKVASIPSARIQIYFIDNDDYFARKAVLTDAEGNEIGHITSGTMSPCLKVGIGMAYVKSEFAKVGTVVCVIIRDRLLKAEVVKLPFV